jgi:hypothetical protein
MCAFSFFVTYSDVCSLFILWMQAFIILGLAVSGKLQSSKHMHMHMSGILFLLGTC